MGFRLYPTLAILVLFASAGAASNTIASSGHSINSFLSSFNVSSATESALVYTNISYNGGSYLLAYYNSNPYFLINITSGYSFVLNSSAISLVIAPAIIRSSMDQINTTYLSKSMIAYNISTFIYSGLKTSTAATISDCLNVTGLSQPGASCTLANLCESCHTIPLCGGPSSKSALSTYGQDSPFTAGIQNFETNYTELASNMSMYYSAVSSLKLASTVQAGLVSLNSAFNNLSTITQGLYQNPIFTPPSSEPACNPAILLSEQPWYCVAYGYCGVVSYNYSLLNNIQSYISKINSLPLSSAQISSVAQTVASNENSYASVILASADLKQRNQILNTTLAGYNGVVTGATSLLVSISNATLSARLSALSANYSTLMSSYTVVNLNTLNSTLKRQYAALSTLYSSLNSSYYSALEISQNNTALLLGLESESSSPQPQVVSLSFQEARLNTQLTSSKLSNINAVQSNLSALNAQIKAVPHAIDLLGAASRSMGAPFAVALLGSSSFSNGVMYAPLAATIPAVIISLVILLALFLLYRRLNKHGRIRHARKTNKNWKILFVIVSIVLLLYILESYSSSVTANSSASLTDAASAIGSAKGVAIAINGTSNPYLVSCENKIASALSKQSKTVYKISINGEACSASSVVRVTNACLGQYASSGVPVIILSNSTKNTLTAYSFYGTILSQSGNPQFTNSCLASLFLG